LFHIIEALYNLIKKSGLICFYSETISDALTLNIAWVSTNLWNSSPCKTFMNDGTVSSASGFFEDDLLDCDVEEI